MSTAAAGADTLSVAVATATPEQAVPVSVQFSGGTSQDSSLLAVVRPAGGIACQPSYESDQTAAGNANRVLFGHFDAEESPGSFSERATYTPPNPGDYLVCAWVEANDTNSDVTAGPISTTFTARGPQVTQLTVALAGSAKPRKAFQIAYTTQTDQQLNLYSVVKPAGALACAASYELETQQNQSETTIFGHFDQQVFGGPTTTTGTDTEQKSGPYVICTWIEGPNNEQVDAATSTAIYVGSPPAPPACSVPKLTAGTPLAKIEQSILANHCTVGPIAYAYSRIARRGAVLSLNPASGSKLASGAAISIKVSAGPPGAPCRVPRIHAGSKLRSAKLAILKGHCTVGPIHHRRDRHVRRGRVISVAPRPGTRHPARTPVAITLSSGAKRRANH